MLPASCAQAVMVMMVVMMVMMMKKMIKEMMIPSVGISMYSGKAILYFDK